MDTDLLTTCNAGSLPLDPSLAPGGLREEGAVVEPGPAAVLMPLRGPWGESSPPLLNRTAGWPWLIRRAGDCGVAGS